MRITADPRATRPDFPPGYTDASSRPWRPLRWDYAEKRLTQARTYWIASTRDNGRPVCRPFWGVWVGGVLLFSTGSAMRRYLAARPAVTAHIDDGDHAVIVEGTADVTSDRELLTRALDSYNPKYNEKVTVETVGEMIVVRPAVVFAWKVEHGASFVDEATRFTFGG